jgi:hypothetical protein
MSVAYTSYTDDELLLAYVAVMAELRRRGITRSSNNPVADYAEGLIARSLNLTLAGRSAAGYDAVDSQGLKYQIKGRRLTPENPSTQLSHIRRLESRPFDVLAAVIFDVNFSVDYAALIPPEVVLERARFSAHANAHIFLFKRDVLSDPRVTDITSKLTA